MLHSLCRFDCLQTIDCVLKGLKEVINDNFIIPSIRHQVFFTRFRDPLDLLQQGSVLRVCDAVLKKL